MSQEKPQWTELYNEVVTGGLCTGCAACVIACPHDVLNYNDANGVYKPFHLDIDGDLENCTHGEKGCTLCTRACPRFRNWETEIDEKRFERVRADDEDFGIALDIVLARTTDPELADVGQDGGFVSALLTFALENDFIDAALVSGLEGDGSTWQAIPALATTRADVIATAGSRYTYSANTLAYPEAIEGGAVDGALGHFVQVSGAGWVIVLAEGGEEAEETDAHAVRYAADVAGIKEGEFALVEDDVAGVDVAVEGADGEHEESVDVEELEQVVVAESALGEEFVEGGALSVRGDQDALGG